MTSLAIPAYEDLAMQRHLAQTSAPTAGGTSRKLRVAGLFAGIGGLELGLAQAGHETELLCEIDAAALEVLDAHFPKTQKHTDIRTLKRLPKGLDLLVGGFPCQDLSQAGKTAGIAGSRSGLVGEVFRLLETHRVPLVLLENVPFMLQLARGRALEVIVSALEQLGYKWAYRVIDSRAFGVPQRRERVYLIACLHEDPRKILLSDDSGPVLPDPAKWQSYACGFYWTEGVRGLGWAVNAVPTLKNGSTVGIPSPPAIILPSGEVVKPDIRDAERMQGFEPDWTLPAERIKRKGCRWSLVGNSVTVPVAAWLGKQLASPAPFDVWTESPVSTGRAWPRIAWNVGDGRYTMEMSTWPVCRSAPLLERFLNFPTVPLSVKATAGFLTRAGSGSLRFPDGFIKAIEAHLARVRPVAISA